MHPRIQFRPLGAWAGAFALGLILATAPAAAQTPAPDDPVVATVDGEEIRLAEIMELHATLPESYANVPLAALMEPLIAQAVNSRLVLAKGKADGLEDDPLVQQRLAEIESRLIQELWLTRQVEAAVTEAALRERFKGYLSENPPQSEIKASHILLKTEAEAREMVSRLDGGANFGELARDNSTGPSARQNGDLGFFAQGQMVPAFEAAAFGLETGQYTKVPVKTQFGWHVIQVTDRRTAEPPTYEAVRDELRADLSQRAVGRIIEGLRSGAKIEIKPLDPALLQGGQPQPRPR